jgi:peptidoglycan/xylan/chitin deacetylase (PgdA/CDA1 family)
MHPTGETHPMAQVQSYLRFAKTKREENAREVDLTFDDVRQYKLQVNPKP